MHYYKFNIPDWNLHTAHLSLVEEAVYRRLIDHYYDTESPIPTETQPVFRRLRLANESDIALAILSEFFRLTDDGWRHKRCDDVIADFHKKAGANRENGKSGGRPRKESLTDNPEETQSVAKINPAVTLTTNQELLTIDKPRAAKKAARKSPETTLPEDFSLSARVQDWAAEKGYSRNRVSENLAKFLLWAKAKGATYSDWDAALMGAIRDDWAKVGDASPSGSTSSLPPAGSLYRYAQPLGDAK